MALYSVYFTTKDKKEAEKIGKALIEKKLIACVNIFPITSFYVWKGKLVKDKEYAIIAKTTVGFKIVEKAIKKLHSYKIPCICKYDVVVNKEYEKWVNGVCK
mgnify:CR=1 FL=1